MINDVTIEVGTSAEEMGRRFIEAWEAAERGEVRPCYPHLIFESVADLPPNAQPSEKERPFRRGAGPEV